MRTVHMPFAEQARCAISRFTSIFNSLDLRKANGPVGKPAAAACWTRAALFLTISAAL
jgi:hypothetical protein